MNKNSRYIKAGLVLVISGIIVKILSAVYRIPLTRMLGPYEMGRYSTIFNIFMPFFAFATSGITPCVSKYTAEYYANNNLSAANSIKRKAILVYTLFSLLLTSAFIVFGILYSKTVGDKIILMGVVVLSPNIIFATLEAVYKGYTQGKMDMLPTAKANLIESISKTVLGLAGVFGIKYVVQNSSGNWLVLICTLSVTISGFICAWYLVSIGAEPIKLKHQCKGEVSYKKLLKMSVAISISALLVSLVNFFDTAVCLPLIKKLPYDVIVQSYNGASFKGAEDISIYLFGIYNGMVLTVFNLIPAILSSFGVACLPFITKVMVLNDKEKTQRSANKIFMLTSCISVPMCFYGYHYRKEILSFLFSTNEYQTQISAQLLGIIIPFGVAASFIFSFNNILYAFDKTDTVFKTLLFASIVKCVVSFVMCKNPYLNIKAFAISSCLFFLIIFVLNIFQVKKLGIKFDILKIFFVPIAASMVGITIVRYLTHTALSALPLFLVVVFSGIIFSLVYILIIILTMFLVDI